MSPNALYDNLNNPLMWGYVAFFGCLMGAVRWWRQADPLRSTKLGLWRTAACVLGALVVQVFIPFPSGFLIAVTMAVAIQIAAPFVDREERKLICESNSAGVVA